MSRGDPILGEATGNSGPPQIYQIDRSEEQQMRARYAAGGPGHGGVTIGPKPMESSTAIPDPSLIAVLKEISASIKENTTITREAWHAIVTGQQAAPPLNEGDFQEIDLCANDAEDEFIEPHIRLKKLLPVAQERHLTSKEPIALIMGGAIYHIGLKVEDITGIVAKCR